MLRTIQGFAAGSATVLAPSVVRATLADADAVRGLAAISMVEAIVPAAGPVLGAALLSCTDWRATFWIIAVSTLAVIPFALRAVPHELPGLDRRFRPHTGRFWPIVASCASRRPMRSAWDRCSRSSRVRHS